MPSFPRVDIRLAAPAIRPSSPRLFVPAPRGAHNTSLTGFTRDSAGTPLASCTVYLFHAGDESFVAVTTSDGSGAYTFSPLADAGPFFIVAYKAGSPDVEGTTVNTLTAS